MATGTALLTPPVVAVGFTVITLKVLGFAFVQMPYEQVRDAVRFCRGKRRRDQELAPPNAPDDDVDEAQA